MSAYNKVNGTYSSEHPRLLTTILRDEWGLNDSAVRMAARGAETLGLLGAGQPTVKGRALAFEDCRRDVEVGLLVRHLDR